MLFPKVRYPATPRLTLQGPCYLPIKSGNIAGGGVVPGIHRLTQRDIDTAKPGKRLSDGGGLFLHVRERRYVLGGSVTIKLHMGAVSVSNWA